MPMTILKLTILLLKVNLICLRLDILSWRQKIFLEISAYRFCSEKELL